MEICEEPLGRPVRVGSRSSARPLRVGTDCSGIDAPICALLHHLKVPFEYLFGSDIERSCQQVIKDGHAPMRMYRDMTRRSLEKLPRLDLYVCGFPCQSFSLAGKKRGLEDERVSELIPAMLDTIRQTRPRVFVLENVPNAKETTKEILANSYIAAKYYLRFFTLDSYLFGVPQKRCRMYCVGVREKYLCAPLERPKPLTTPPPLLADVLLPANEIEPLYFSELDETERVRGIREYAYGMIRTRGGDPDRENWVFNSGASQNFLTVNKECICTILKGKASTYYLTSQKRFLTPRELYRLQGFPDDWPMHPARTTAGAHAGNSMCVGCVAAAIDVGLRAGGLLPGCPPENVVDGVDIGEHPVIGDVPGSGPGGTCQQTVQEPRET